MARVVVVPPYLPEFPNSIFHAKLDPSSMNMKLAEGLVNRLHREVVEANSKMDKVLYWHLSNIVSAGVTKMNKAFDSFIRSISVSGNVGFICKGNSTKPKDWEIFILAWEDDCVQHAFSFHLYAIKPRGLVKTAVLSRLSRHALARMISRMKATDISQCLLEFMSMHNSTNVKSRDCEAGDQFTVKSRAGVGFYKKEDDGRAICVTWVDDNKLSADQKNVDDDYINLLAKQAEADGLPFLWSVGYTDAQTKVMYSVWSKSNTGDMLTFLYDTEACIKLHRARIGEGHKP